MFSVQKIKLFVTTECNMACEYCMIKNSHDFMDFATSKKAVDKYIFWTDFEDPVKFVYFFGGEPLLNFPLIQEITEYIEQQRQDFWFEIRLVICTNFTIVSNKILQWLHEHNIFLSISIGGFENIHNEHRVFAVRNTANAFEMTTRNILHLQKMWYQKEKIGAWLVILHKYISSLFDFFDFLVETLALNHVNIEFIVEKTPWKIQDFEIFRLEYHKILHKILHSITTEKYIFLNNLNWKILQKIRWIDKNPHKPFQYLTEIHPSGDVFFSGFFTFLEQEKRQEIIVENICDDNHLDNIFQKISSELFLQNNFDAMKNIPKFRSDEAYPLLKNYISKIDEKMADVIVNQSRTNPKFSSYIQKITKIYF